MFFTVVIKPVAKPPQEMFLKSVTIGRFHCRNCFQWRHNWQHLTRLGFLEILSEFIIVIHLWDIFLFTDMWHLSYY